MLNLQLTAWDSTPNTGSLDDMGKWGALVDVVPRQGVAAVRGLLLQH